jgi:hypothetical protein
MLRATFDVIVLAGAIFATSAASSPQAKIPVPQVPRSSEVDPKMPMFIVCAKACDDCARHCETCAAHCASLLVEGRKEHHRTLRLCLDCAAFCQAASSITAKDGPMSDLICKSCAEACKMCGDECDKHPADPIMKRCAEECHKCEKACRDMVKQTIPPKP